MINSSTAFALHKAIGNRAIQRLIQDQNSETRLAPSMGNQIFRYVEYNDETIGGRFTDPEQASGTLPFDETGWDGAEIGRNLSQLDTAVAKNDNVRCVETAFLVSMVQRGPGAVREMIENYLGRCRLGLSQASTPEDIKHWYQRSLRNLEPLPEKIDNQTLPYDDLSTMLTEMYKVYGSGSGGTEEGVESNMMRREGYRVASVGKTDVTQEQAAAEAQALLPGESLACSVECSRAGTDPVNHRITLGRYPDEGGSLYLYDPWPVIGDQMVDVDEDLDLVDFYFTNVDSETTEVGENSDNEGGAMMTVETIIARHFDVDLKYSPPAEQTEGG